MIIVSGCGEKKLIQVHEKEKEINSSDSVESIEENKNDIILTKTDFLEKLVNISPASDVYSYLDNYDKLDELLNDIYMYLKNHMDKDEFEKLKQDEINWIKFKETIKEVRKYRGCSVEGMEAKYTKERCYYLISLIDDLKYTRSTTLVALDSDIKITEKISGSDINEIIDLLEEMASNKQEVDIIYYYIDSIAKDNDDFLVTAIQYGVYDECIYGDYETGANDGYFGKDFYCKIDIDNNLSLKQNCSKVLDKKKDILPKYELTISRNSETKKLKIKQGKQ